MPGSSFLVTIGRATQKGHLDLWGNAWFVAGLGAGALGLILLLAASVLYFGRRRAAR